MEFDVRHSPGIARLLAAFALAALAATSPVPADAQASHDGSSPGAPPEPADGATSPPPKLRPYGTLWAGAFATQGVQSYGFPTAVAPTAAVNPALVSSPNEALLSFQVQQTRVGVVVGEGSAFRGQLELDFVHFDQSSPTTQAFPRVRIASLEWEPASGHTLFLGQTWDLFGNASGPQLLSHSWNLVGTLFQAGNIGFMRHQLGWKGRFGRLELAAAAGFQGANFGPSFGDFEKGFTPTGAARAMVHLGDHGVVGVSGIGTSLELSGGDARERRAAFGAELFADLRFGGLELHAELYAARNLANLGALNLGQGRFGHDVGDVGGYASARFARDAHAFTAMFGAAAVLRPTDVIPGYTPATVGPNATAATPLPASGPGITSNLTAHVGYWYSPIDGLSLVVEPYVFATRFALAPSDAPTLDPRAVSVGASIGSIYVF